MPHMSGASVVGVYLQIFSPLNLCVWHIFLFLRLEQTCAHTCVCLFHLQSASPIHCFLLSMYSQFPSANLPFLTRHSALGAVNMYTCVRPASLAAASVSTRFRIDVLFVLFVLFFTKRPASLAAASVSTRLDAPFPLFFTTAPTATQVPSADSDTEDTDRLLSLSMSPPSWVHSVLDH